MYNHLATRLRMLVEVLVDLKKYISYDERKAMLLHLITEIVIDEPVANITTPAAPEAEYNSVRFSISDITIAQVRIYANLVLSPVIGW